MTEGSSEWRGAPAPRDPGKLATTTITNELAAALGAFSLSDGRVEGLPGRFVLVKIIGNETGGGKYKCEVWEHSADFRNPARNLSTADFEKKKRVANAVYINLQEMGQTTHTLTHGDNASQKYFLAFFDGYTAETNRRMVFVGNAAWFDDCDD